MAALDKTWTLDRISRVDATQLAFDAGVFIFVNENYIIEWSTPEANKLFGYVFGELDGKQLEVLISPDKRINHRKVFARFFESPTDRNMGTEIMQTVFEGYKKDKSTIRVSIHLRVRAIDGKKIAVAMIFPVIEIK